MERFWFVLAEFVIALVLVAGLLIVKRGVDKCIENVEFRVKQITERVLSEQFRKWTGCYICDLDKFVDKRIDIKLAEKEGERDRRPD